MIYRLVQDYLRHSWVGSGSFRLLIVWSTGSIRSVQVDSGFGSGQFIGRFSSLLLGSSRFKVGLAQFRWDLIS